MSAWWQFKALIRKNMQTLKRSVFMTLMEIFYPIILMIICYLIKLAFNSTKVTWEEEGGLDEYLISKGNFAFDYSIYTHLTIFTQLMKAGYVGQYPNLNFDFYFDYICNNNQICLTEDETAKNLIQSRITKILTTLSPSSGVWKYIDPLEETHDIDVSTIAGLPVKPITMICYNRFVIAFVGFKETDELGQIIKTYISIENNVLQRPYSYMSFDSISELNDYVTAEDYGLSHKPHICFGIYFKKEGTDKYSASLHYFNDAISHGIEDVPNNIKPMHEEMQQGPNMDDVQKYSDDGYIQVMNILTNYMLKQKNPLSYVNYGFAVQKYDEYSFNEFAAFAGVYFTFFVILSYLCPLILYVLKMVVEKESRAKEVMKIMGMGEGTYFLSYFVEYFIVNIIYAFAVGYVSKLTFKFIPYLYLVLYLWLFGLNIFALAFFCQSFMDTTRLALIVSCLIYCLMLFVSAAVYDDNIKKTYKVIAALLPPVNLLLGAFTIGEFERMFFNFETKDVTKNYINYSLSTCYIMFTADFFIYLFLGWYLQNVIPHEYGVAKPWYFLFLPSYWFGDCCHKKNSELEIEPTEEKAEKVKVQTKKVENGQNEEIVTEKIIIEDVRSESSNNSIFDDNPHKDEDDFQNEDIYRDKNKKNDVFMLRNVTKVYGDGKMACNSISFNLFRNEIFALLGRNGAGKTSLINVLIGMYNATSGKAIYKNNNILEERNMNEFRNKLGICPQHDILFPKLTVREHLEMFCYFKGFDVEKIPEEVDTTLKDFRIHDIENVLAGTLSAGQRRKLSIAISVIGGSEVIFLDEPSSGMDITSRRNLWEILKKIIEKRIIILTTHYMEEASVLGNRIGIMAEGVLKCIGTPLFLIEKYGKFLSVNIYKDKNANNDEIINYFKSKAEGIETEILTQEILIRIPKNKPGTDQKNINIQSFFSELDNNVKKLKIKNYSASMPTLEDVFLNIGSVRLEEEEMLNSGKIDEEKNEQILFKQKYIKDFTKTEKFFFDAVALLKKRSFQIYRDTKTFMLEILCPILLVLVGCIVVQIDIFKDSDPIHCDNNSLAKLGNQVIYYGDIGNSQDTFNRFKFDSTNVTSEFLATDETISQYSATRAKESLKNFIEKLYEKENDGSLDNFGALYTINADSEKNQYDVIQVVNGRARQSPMIYAAIFMKQILEKAGIEFEYTHYPLPTTNDNRLNSNALNNFCLVFFVSIAFSLIPANFISSIVSERINNSKHLMRISGVSIFAYWLINFLFELVKYYFTAGLCLLILWAFDFIPDYFYILYLLYGPPMIIITYLTSFFFNSEAVAQNFLILFNLVFGSLGSTVVIMLRAIDKSTNAAKVAAYIIRIIPSFAFGYGYNLLLNGKLILFIDYSIEYLTKPKSIYISLKYAGSDALYLGCTFIVYIICIIIIEINAYKVEEVDDSLLSQGENNQLDKQVEKEIKKANLIEGVELDDDDIIPKSKKEKKEIDTDKNNLIEIEIQPISDKDLILNINDKNKKDFSTDNKTKDLLNSASEQILDQGNYKGINKEDYAVRIKNMQKIYNNGCNIISKPTMGVKNISFTVNYGECFGLLGLNGAGKTTIFKAITEEHSPTHGSLYINGLNLAKNFDRVKLMFGYCPQFDAIFPYMSVYENLEFYSRIKGVAPEKLKEVIQAMIESMTLTKYTNKLAGRLSGGNKRKLSVAISMICNPPIVLLDEPSTGMDPEARRFMWAIIHKLTSKSDSNCVIMTTHAMDEAETLCRRMGIMVNGEFVCLGTSNYIKETYGYGYEIDIRIKPFEQSKLNEILENLGLKRNYKILSLDEAKDILKRINKEKYCKYLEKEGIGRKIYHEITVNGDINLQALINWSRYVKCAMKMIKVVLPHFKEVILSEFIENNFLFKIKKSSDSKSIGFLFTLLEKEKEACEITEYSIQQTSLEQIFNKFAENQGKTEEDIKNSEKVENDIHIDDKLVNDLI